MKPNFAPTELFTRYWLLLLGVLIYTIILVGGATRLTDSGLSITEWAPLSGALPPLSAEAWQSEFDLYKQTTEYKEVNKGMSFSEFQFIYWWEWGHRQLGRFIGLTAILGFVLLTFVFKARKNIVALSLFISLLIGMQGAIGWWMVASGIGETTRVDVAPYRLATHFSLALFILWIIAWNYWRVPRVSAKILNTQPYYRVWPIMLLFLMVFLQMTSGALVAGLDAGRTYSDWPLMAGEFMPAAYADEGLGWRSHFEGRATTQFNHRMLAYILYFWSFILALRYSRPLGWIVFGILSLQVALGIYTLINSAPLPLALAHQGLGVVVMLTTLYWLHFARQQQVIPYG